MQTDEVDVHSAHPSTIFSLLYINSRLIAPAAAYRAAKPRCARAPYISPIAHAYARATYTTSITSRTVHLNLPRTAVAALREISRSASAAEPSVPRAIRLQRARPHTAAWPGSVGAGWHLLSAE